MIKRILLALALLIAPGLAILDRTPEVFDHAQASAASLRAGPGRALLGGRPATVAAFTPASISGLKLWFDASDAASITIGTGVSQWNDKSGNANHATQATGSAQPTVQTAAQNGLNTLRFTATASQRMLLTTRISLGSAWTIIAVVRRGGPGGINIVELVGDTITTAAWPFEFWTDTKLYGASTGGASTAVVSTAQASTAYNVLSVTQPNIASTAKAYFNGVDISASYTGGNGGFGNINTIGFGDSAYTNGEIAEFVVYDTVLSTANRQLVEAYLKAKWGTP